MQFRKDVEGLRAVAIIPILLFHAGLEALSGGFIGVDIFFVISGFLITSIIVKDMDTGVFKLARFYARRVVRIFPPLLVMLAIVCVVGVINLFPAAIRDLGYSAASSAGFVSNIYFWRTTHYFAAQSELQPLLHTWSLGIEEQFYMFFPLFVMFARRTKIPLVAWLLAMVTISLAIALWMATHYQVRSEFFLLPSRAWELGIGALVAVGCYPKLQSLLLRQIASVLGLAAIVAALFLVKADQNFPAPWALLPCLGAALLIAYGHGCVTETLLGSPPMRFIGRISFSLYLWHWPIMAFYRINYGIELTPVETLGLVVASVAAGAISYALVERPFMLQFRSRRPAMVLGIGLPVALAVVIGGVAVNARAENWHSYTPEIAKVISYGRYTSTEDYREQFRPGFCFIEPESNDKMDPSCLALRDDKRNIIVAGDSLAAHYWRALADRYKDDNVIQATAPSCRATIDPLGDPACNAIANAVLGPMLDSGKVYGIVLSGRWFVKDLPRLEKTLDRIKSKGVRVLLVGPSVEYDGQFPELLARAMIAGDMKTLEQTRRTERKVMSDRMAQIAKAHGVPYVSPYDMQCSSPNDCQLLTPTKAPLLFDCCHLTLEETRALVRRFPEL